MSAIWDLLLVERALLTALGPLAGDSAKGNVIATATGADTVLPPFTYGVPIIGGKAIYARMFRVQSTTPINVAPVGPTVTSAGTSVAVRAVCGGVAGNLPAMMGDPPAPTRFLWQPSIAGIERYGTIAPGGLTGGAAVEGPGRCARVVAYDTLAKEEQTRRIWEAQGEGFPALVLAYNGDRVEQVVTVRSARVQHMYRVFVVCTNYLDNDERQVEAKLLIAAVRDRLQGLADVEGDIFTGPACEVEAVNAMGFSPSSHVFAIDISVHDAPIRTDVRLTDGVSWQPWATTRTKIGEPAAPPLPEVDITDVTTGQDP